MIDRDDRLSDDITFKNVVILITHVIRDDGKFHPLILLEKALLVP